ncbi:MAG: flagellar biosynthesis protein FlhB [Phycisphaerae bacterium]
MAEDDFGEKTEAPTPRRRQEARDRGQLGLSNDLTAAVALLAAVWLLRQFGPVLLGGLLDLVRQIERANDVRTETLPETLPRIAAAAAPLVLPFLLLMVLVTLMSTLTQSRGAFTWKMLRPKLSQLSPLAGVKRLFSTRSLARTGFGLLKMMCVGAVAYWTIAADVPRVLAVGQLTTGGIVSLSADVLYRLCMRAGAALVVLGLLDWLYQRWTLERSLKMSKQEIKEEMKRMEGDPHVKQRLRKMQLKLAMQRLAMDVPKADFVVTNPTEYAVAIQYDDATMAAPKVIAKGKDFLALRIRQLAEQHEIPVLERPPLARALYAAVEVGHEVPPAFYRAVAELLAYVYELSGRAPAMARA